MMKPLKGKKLDALIGATWSRIGNGVTISIWDISHIFKAATEAYRLNPTQAAIDDSMWESVARYGKNLDEIEQRVL